MSKTSDSVPKTLAAIAVVPSLVEATQLLTSEGAASKMTNGWTDRKYL